MKKGSHSRRATHPVDALFLDRWSARAMSGAALSIDELMVLFEAARWAPSSFNYQPWRMLYARRDTPHWPLYLSLLSERNRSWAQHGAALVLFLSKLTRDDGTLSVTHAFDTGAAWENFALQASLRGLVVHGMQGFDYSRARSELHIPADFQVNAMVVVGRPGDPHQLLEDLRSREQPNDRRPLDQSLCEGLFGFKS
ncbi:MAG TPA: nitroreductase family protein [Steroidobacteraceae bacterium]|jgi:nitroreductase